MSVQLNIVKQQRSVIKTTRAKNTVSIVQVGSPSVVIPGKECKGLISVKRAGNKITVTSNSKTGLTVAKAGSKSLLINKIGIPGVKGEKGESANYTKIPFSFISDQQLFLLPAVIGDCLLDVRLIIDEAFDDPSATLSIGTVLEPERFIAEEDNDPTEECDFNSRKFHTFTMNESIRLFMNPGTSSQGSGYIVLNKI